MASNISFGKKSMGQPTPTGVSTIIDVISGICGVLIAWMITATFIPHSVSDVLSSILGLMISIAQVLKPFFGVKTDQKNVPIGEVTSMEAPEKKD